MFSDVLKRIAGWVKPGSSWCEEEICSHAGCSSPWPGWPWCQPSAWQRRRRRCARSATARRPPPPSPASPTPGRRSPATSLTPTPVLGTSHFTRATLEKGHNDKKLKSKGSEIKESFLHFLGWMISVKTVLLANCASFQKSLSRAMTTSMFRSVIIIPLKGGFAFDLLLYEIVQGNMITEPLGSLFPLLISNHNASSPSGIKSMLQLLRMVPIGHDCVSWRTRTRLQRLRCGTSGRRERGFCPCKLLEQSCQVFFYLR